MRRRIEERCSCGSTFHYTGIDPLSAADAWRRLHRHEMPITPVTLSPGDQVLMTTNPNAEIDNEAFEVLRSRFPGVRFTLVNGASIVGVERA